MTQAPPAEGSLATLPMRELLSGHSAAASSGRLTVQTSAGEAEIKLVDGMVADARFGPATGEAALLRLMTFADGSFTFEPRSASVSGAGAAALQDLLQKAQAHGEEVLHHAGKLGGLKERFTLDLAQLSKLDPDIRQELGPVLAIIDGKRTVQEVVAATDMPDVTSLRVLRKLKGLGLLKTDAELEAERKAREAAAAAAAAAPPAPATVDEMLLAEAARQELERTAMLEFAAGAAVSASDEERERRAARAEAFAAAEPTPLTAPPSATRRTTPPAGTPVAQRTTPTEPAPAVTVPVAPPPAAPAAAATPAPPVGGRPSREEVRLDRRPRPDSPPPSILRWTERPELPPQPSDELESQLNERAAPVPVAPAVTAPPGVAAPPPQPVIAPVDPREASAMNPAPPPPTARAARAETPPPAAATPDEARPPAPERVGAPPAAEEAHHDDFFARGQDSHELAALLEQSNVKDEQEANNRLFGYVAAGVGGVAVLLIALFMLTGRPPEPEAPAVVEPAGPEPARPNVVIGDMGAQVRTQQEVAHDLTRVDLSASAAPQKSPAELAAELAGEKPVVPVAKNPEPAPAVETPPEKPAEKPVVDKPVDKPVAKPVEKPAAKPVEKPAPAEKPAEDPQRLFADRFEKGKKLLDQERYDEAKRAFDSALKFDPGSARAYAQLGRVHYELGNLDEASRHLRKAEALDSSHSYTYLVLGLVLQERGDLPGAEKAYEKYLALDSSGPNARAVQGFLKALRGQRAKKP